MIQAAYNRFVRPRLPRKWGVFNGTPARAPKLLDIDDHHPAYKQGLKHAIGEHVDQDGHAVLIGGGRGVSTVWLSDQGAIVTAYEAAKEMLPVWEDTIEANNVDDAELRHALVGDAVELFGELGEADVVSPDTIDVGDVLVLDCEGAELSILPEIDKPDRVIVETHPEQGASTESVADCLSERGYRVSQYDYEPNRPDKYVLVGLRDGDHHP